MPRWLAWLLTKLIRLYAWTFRVTIEDPANVFQNNNSEPLICPMWHNRIIFQPLLAPKEFLKKTTVLISASRDGEYITAIITRLGLQVVRGSSSRGALHAFLGLRRALRDGYNAGLAIDGPRGPRYTVHSGAAELALKSGIALCPLSFEASRCWRLPSWDGTIIPRPFARITVRVSTPFHPDPAEEIEKINQKIRQLLLELSGEALPVEEKVVSPVMPEEKG